MDTKEQVANRMVAIIRTSVIGIVANVLLSGFKAFVGIVTGSIAITLDAVNNLSDALSSIITIVGTRLAAKAPDKKHPYGHGRIEYLTASIIGIIVMYAGLTSLIESIKKIIHPTEADYSAVSLMIVAVAVVVKILLGLYVKTEGKKYNSDSLVASGQDALLDAVISTTTLIAAFVFLGTGIGLEAYLGAIISIIILKAGIDMIRESLSQILGERAESDLTKSIKQTICEFDEVHGAYDLILNNYGPDTYMASVHVEIDSTMSAPKIDALARKISQKIYEEYQIVIGAVGIYAYDAKDPETQAILSDIRTRMDKYEEVLQFHGFFVNKEEMTISFDVVIDFSAKDRYQLYQTIKEEIQNAYPKYHVAITLDEDFSD